MSAVYQAQRLDRLRAFLRTKPPGLAADDATTIAASIDRYFAKRSSLDEAMGLQLDRGENHPGATLAIEARDAELRAAAAKLGQISWANSKKLAAMMERYWSGPWQRERALETCPVNRDGRIEGHFWRALMAWPRVVKERQMHLIAAAERVTKSPFDCTRTGLHHADGGESTSFPSKK